MKGKTIQDEYILNLHRLHLDDHGFLPPPPQGSLFYQSWETRRGKLGPSPPPDSDNLYLQKFVGLFGEFRRSAGKTQYINKSQAENILPVIAASILFAIGWALVLEPETWTLFKPLIPSFISTPLNPLNLPIAALKFGFLGSYFFVLQMLVRRYFQDDLKTTAYINSSVRIVTVALLVAAVGMIWPLVQPQIGSRPENGSQPQADSQSQGQLLSLAFLNGPGPQYGSQPQVDPKAQPDSQPQGQLLALAFLIGVFPQVGLQILQKMLAFFFQPLIPNLKKQYPLSDLDGLNIWYESRLMEEGIEDMQNLATANLVDVLIRTRVPVDRLVDWVDQAHLYLRISKDKKDNSRQKLRDLGVRSATDLEDVLCPKKTSSLELEKNDNELTERLRWVLNGVGEDDGKPSKTERIAKALATEPNLYHVRHWKKFTADLEQRDIEDEVSTSPNSESFGFV